MSLIQSDFLNFKNIRHGFSLRYGGVSLKPWKSLNCSYFVNDNAEHVRINKRKILYNLGFISDFYIKQAIRLWYIKSIVGGERTTIKRVPAI